ncbi:MAG: hypothetical protein JWP61_1661 [Friedmanniella sp.]|nr:hypothetical protein [Friedmanniella sp.]
MELLQLIVNVAAVLGIILVGLIAVVPALLDLPGGSDSGPRVPARPGPEPFPA